MALLPEINQVHDLFSSRLPIEVCAEIFQQALPSVDLISKRHGMGRRVSSVPLLLSHVCQRWRAICLSLPHLWTVISLFISGSQSRAEKVADSMAWSWVGRSGSSLPLSIILFMNPMADLDGTHSRSIFNLIKTYAHRIYYLQATVSSPALRELCAVYQDRQNLKTLRISCDIFVRDRSRIKSVDLAKFRPTSLFIDNTARRIVGIDTSILTHGEFEGFIASHCVALLANSPVLVSCTLRNVKPDIIAPAQRLVHLRLQRISVDQSSVNNPTFEVLDGLSLPSLDSMELLLPRHGQQLGLLVSTIDHLRQSGSSLRSLSVVNLSLQSLDEYLRLSELVQAVSHSLEALDLSKQNAEVSTPSEREHLSEFLQYLLPRFVKLRSVTMFIRKREWLHTLRRLLIASLSIVSATTQELLVTLWSNECPIDSEGNTSADTAFDFSDTLVPLDATDLRNMVNILGHQLVSLKAKYSSTIWLDLRDPITDIDISVEIMAALGSMLTKTQAP